MRLASVSGRAHLVLPDDALCDIQQASDGGFGPTMQSVLDDWDRFTAWVASGVELPAQSSFDAAQADPVVAAPAQVFAVGLNYRAHALEAGATLPEVPLVFTKFPSCVAPAFGTVGLYTDSVDWEIEVAVVVGRGGFGIVAADAWAHIAGVTGAQDYSARDTQFASSVNPQFSLGKSYPGFLPLGPLLVTPDEYDDPDAIGLECTVNGVLRQSSSTSDLIFGVPQIVEYISSICTLRPGDVILTGTPSGVGMGLKPPVYLRPGDQVVSRVDLAGEMRQVAAAVNR